mmetsp:Transcript_41949/g.97236  ORF Transcript_41949/g.97236 Transcript_41949/m.97236 type:complete len:286 (-) Transcript_41949:179-1036(-)
MHQLVKGVHQLLLSFSLLLLELFPHILPLGRLTLRVHQRLFEVLLPLEHELVKVLHPVVELANRLPVLLPIPPSLVQELTVDEANARLFGKVVVCDVDELDYGLVGLLELLLVSLIRGLYIHLVVPIFVNPLPQLLVAVNSVVVPSDVKLKLLLLLFRSHLEILVALPRVLRLVLPQSTVYLPLPVLFRLPKHIKLLKPLLHQLFKLELLVHQHIGGRIVLLLGRCALLLTRLHRLQLNPHAYVVLSQLFHLFPLPHQQSLSVLIHLVLLLRLHLVRPPLLAVAP